MKPDRSKSRNEALERLSKVEQRPNIFSRICIKLDRNLMGGLLYDECYNYNGKVRKTNYVRKTSPRGHGGKKGVEREAGNF